MEDEPDEVGDAEIIGLAQAERDAGIPDVQTAAAAVAAKERTATCDEAEGPS